MHSRATNLSDLIERLRARDVASTEEAFDYLAELVGPHVKIRCEFTRMDEAPQSVDSDRGETDAKRRAFAHLNHCMVTRVLLTAKRLRIAHGATHTNELTMQCNGIVLEYPTWTVLSIPARMFIQAPHRFGQGQRSAALADYTIYSVNDGTIVTLYHYKGAWRMASTNGFDVGDYQWMGARTYMELFCEVAALYPEFAFDKLDTGKCYTVGFRHHNFHPLLADPAKIWLVQSCDLHSVNGPPPDSVITATNEQIGLPLQEKIKLPARNMMTWIHEHNAAAFKRFVNTATSPQPDIHYGFIFRAAPGCVEPDVLMESELLKTVRGLIYSMPKGDSCITPANRLEYITLRAYLGFHTRNVFLTLFPQYAERHKKFDVMFGKLTRRVIEILRNTRVHLEPSGDTKIDLVAKAIATHLSKHVAVNVTTFNGASLVNDWVLSASNLPLYFQRLIQ